MGQDRQLKHRCKTFSLSRSAAHYPFYELFPFRGLVQGPEADLTSTAISAAPTPTPIEGDAVGCVVSPRTAVPPATRETD